MCTPSVDTLKGYIVALNQNFTFDLKKITEIGNETWQETEFSGHDDTEKFLFGISLGSFKVKAFKEKLSQKQNSVHFIMAHSGEHRDWATQVGAQLTESLHEIFPAIQVTTSLVSVGESADEVRVALKNYNQQYEKNKADQTFVVTIGWQESQLVSATNSYDILPYPQLFCLPGSPGELLNEVVKQRNNQLYGGVYCEHTSAQKYINSILSFKSNTTQICIAYDPAPTSDLLRIHIAKQVAALEAACASKNIQVRHHHWSPAESNFTRLRGVLHNGVDSVIILNEPAALTHRQQLVLLCNAVGKFICASELDSVFAGAALGGGVTGGSFGIPLATLVTQYLIYDFSLKKWAGWNVYKIPEQSGMRCNEWAFGLQGVVLSDEKDALLKMKSVFDESCEELA
jgi:hypothetical protein